MKYYKVTVLSLLLFLIGLIIGCCTKSFSPIENLISEEVTQVAPAQAHAASAPTKIAQKEVAKPSVLLFHSEHCSSCAKIMPVWKALKKEYKKDFNFYEIDVDAQQNARLCIEFLITTIPSIYIEDVPFRNRAYVNPVMYGYLPRFEDELSRYLDLRKILKKGLESEN